MDGDGNLDLYVANYVDFTCANHVPEFSDGFPVYTSPKAYNPCRHSIFHNRGDGTFADVTEESGIGAHVGPGMGAVCTDYDNDGHTDIFVCNDGYGNFCWHNDGRGHFEEVALTNGLKFNGDGAPVASMGADAADYDHDGWFDIFQTSYQGERPILFRNLGGIFEDVTRLTDTAAGGLNNVKWGCGFGDFDNDGQVDIFYVIGHIQDNVELFDRTTSYEGSSHSPPEHGAREFCQRFGIVWRRPARQNGRTRRGPGRSGQRRAPRCRDPQFSPTGRRAEGRVRDGESLAGYPIAGCDGQS